MASTASAPTLRQLTLPSSFLLVAAGGAWVAVIALGRGMSGMTGTMGLSFGGFVVVWALMMVAMMLPTVAPFAALYTRTITGHRARRIGALAGGYLLVWTLAAVPAYALSWVAGELAGSRPTAARVAAVGAFAACGVYQFTPIKERCLARCRSPLGFLFAYAGRPGRFRDLRVGVSHGGFCLACCWALMVVLIAVGLMNPLAMVLLSAVVLAEKTWRWGRRLSLAVGVLALALAVGVAFRPGLAPGLYRPPDMGADQMALRPVR
jgi:predicted metal-binding membrane protein